MSYYDQAICDLISAQNKGREIAERHLILQAIGFLMLPIIIGWLVL